jgi:ubiquinone/menaquinone biosynthesis C-methylase UbiE
MSPTDSTGTYRILARFYDLLDLIWVLGGRGNPREGLLDIIGQQQQRVLEVAVGTATSAITVASQRPESQVVGLDTSADMLAVARRKIRDRGLTNVSLVQAGADAMPFEDASFDIVMVSFALHEFEPELRDRALAEMARVLKRGGRLCVIDFARQRGLANRTLLGLLTVVEPACFGGFLELDWRAYAQVYGLRLDAEADYSFSTMRSFEKTEACIAGEMKLVP